MININGKLYKGNADYRIVKIDGEWKEIIVLTTDREINDYEQIRTNQVTGRKNIGKRLLKEV